MELSWIGIPVTMIVFAFILIGSLNQMRFMLDARVGEVEDVMLLNPLSVNRWLCHYPVSINGVKGFWMADQAMIERVESL